MSNTTQSVVLPDGATVCISDVPESWWTSNDASGYISPISAAPDPDQPRKYIHPDRLAELDVSVAACGVRQALTVTPLHLAPWARVKPEHRHAFFLIVSGHRRWNSANHANLPAIPITIKLYASEKEHRLDGSLLNRGHEPLTEIEEAMEIVQLRESGWKIRELVAHYGFTSDMQIYGRINLTRLHPDIQLLIMPQVAEKRRLAITTAQVLGGLPAPTADELSELQENFRDMIENGGAYVKDCSLLDEEGRRFALQKMLVAVILIRKLNAVRGVEFIREHSLRLERHASHQYRNTRRYEPAKRREIIANFITQVTGSVLMDWSPDEFRRVFELASREEVEEVLCQLKEASDVLHGFSRILERIRDGKRHTHPDALRIIREEKLRTAAS